MRLGKLNECLKLLSEECMFSKLVILFSVPLFLLGCTKDYGHYAQAVKEQNLTTQLKIEERSRDKAYRKDMHQERMASFQDK